MYVKRCVSCMKEIEGPQCPYCGFHEDQETQDSNVLKWNTILHGRYLVGKVLGQGGFGITYVGYDLLLDIKVAIKEYFPMGYASRDMEYSNQLKWNTSQAGQTQWKTGCDNFLKEAKKMARIDSIPEIVRVRDTFFENNTAYIVMDFVEGQTMKAWLKVHGPMNIRECLKLLGPLMEGLAKVHKLGMIHRDISPDNIMILPDGKVRLLDLGAAKDTTTSQNGASQLVTKRGFSPAEQYLEDGNIGPWTDVYAFSATMYYAVTGKLVPESIGRVMEETLKLDADPSKGLTGEVMNVFRDGLAVSDKNRIQTMTELLERFQKAVPELGQGAETASGKRGRAMKFVTVGLAAIGGLFLVMVIWTMKEGSRGKVQGEPSQYMTAAETASPEDTKTAGVKADTGYFEEQKVVLRPDSCLEDTQLYATAGKERGYLFVVHGDSQNAINTKINAYNETLTENGIEVDTSGSVETVIPFYNEEMTVTGKYDLFPMKLDGKTIGGIAGSYSGNIGGGTIAIIFTDDIGKLSLETMEYFQEGSLVASPESLVDGIVLEETGGSVAEPSYTYSYSENTQFEMYVNALESIGLEPVELSGAGLEYVVRDGDTKYQITRPSADSDRFTVAFERMPEVWEENGRTYHGFRIDGKAEGICFIESDTWTYLGECETGYWSGVGIYRSERIRYEGEVKSSKYQGYGSMEWTSGEEYYGQWENGQQNGLGSVTWPSGNSYLGEWQDGHRTGRGYCSYNNGDEYIGEFKDGALDGIGSYVYSDSNVKSGTWKQNSYEGEAEEMDVKEVEDAVYDIFSEYEELGKTKMSEVEERLKNMKEEYEGLKEKYPEVFPED